MVKFDATAFHAMSCLDKVKFLHDVYLQLLSGNQRVRVQYHNFTTEYRPQYQNDVAALRDLYMSYWNMCEEARATLPDLSVGAKVKRGPPSWGTIGRG